MSNGYNTPLSVSLNPIRHLPISQGGFSISYRGKAPSGTTVWLGLPDATNAIDVTNKPQSAIIDSANLPRFLSLIGHQHAWGSSQQCRLFVRRGSELIAQSQQLRFDCPVRPYVGRLEPSLGKGDAGPPLRYTGTPPHYPDGRVLRVPAIDGCHYFSHKGFFETDNNKRGFNCITYVGAVYGVDVKSKAMSAYGTQLANHCGCTIIGCENQTLDKVKAFFIAHPRGTYLMWSSHHIVIVVNAVVHEFREKFGRYNSQPIAQWTHRDNHWWVRKSMQSF